MNALRNEKCALEGRLSAQSMQLEELQVQQCSVVTAFEEEKRALESEVASLKKRESEAMMSFNENTSAVVTGFNFNACGGEQSSSGRVKSDATDYPQAATESVEPKPLIPFRAFSLAIARDRSDIEAEERRINDANLLKRRLRRQNRQRQT
ncbi:hypothetical protein L915_15899 [Phytophthora nicotianae]|uniref:Uncharacterized protein n=2 Tax=Phytophthora nicotianae TaxID=4792 RepID=W2IDI4_PHYNI|nr:hypothetical protein L915_15899 [Phytophthora nicotianae]ETL31428.1 hypothetical protein L916_15794 [Phytophthora nicotianae]